MFSSVGWGELVVVALAALFIFGPERLPELAKDAASGLRRVRGVMAGAREQLDDVLGDDVGSLRDLDPRRYHPRTLLREHLLGDDGAAAAAADEPRTIGSRARVAPARPRPATDSGGGPQVEGERVQETSTE